MPVNSCFILPTESWTSYLMPCGFVYRLVTQSFPLFVFLDTLNTLDFPLPSLSFLDTVDTLDSHILDFFLFCSCYSFGHLGCWSLQLLGILSFGFGILDLLSISCSDSFVCELTKTKCSLFYWCAPHASQLKQNIIWFSLKLYRPCDPTNGVSYSHSSCYSARSFVSHQMLLWNHVIYTLWDPRICPLSCHNLLLALWPHLDCSSNALELMRTNWWWWIPKLLRKSACIATSTPNMVQNISTLLLVTPLY